MNSTPQKRYLVPSAVSKPQYTIRGTPLGVPTTASRPNPSAASPSQPTQSRSDVHLLEQALHNKLAVLEKSRSSMSTDDYIKGASRIFDGVAYELIDQISTECVERANLLATLWVRTGNTMAWLSSVFEEEKKQHREEQQETKRSLDSATEQCSVLCSMIQENAEKHAAIQLKLVEDEIRTKQANSEQVYTLQEDLVNANGAIRELLAENKLLKTELKKKRVKQLTRREFDKSLGRSQKEEMETFAEALSRMGVTNVVDDADAPQLQLGSPTHFDGTYRPLVNNRVTSLGNELRKVLNESGQQDSGDFATLPNAFEHDNEFVAPVVKASAPVHDPYDAYLASMGGSNLDGDVFEEEDPVVGAQRAEILRLQLVLTDMARKIEKLQDVDKVAVFRSCSTNTEARTTKDAGVNPIPELQRRKGGRS